jgi:transposase
MGRKDNEVFARRVIHFYENQGQRSKKVTATHFFAEGKKKKSIRQIITRYESTGKLEYKKLSGRPPSVATARKISKVKLLFQRVPSTSVRVVARKLNLKRSTLSDMKVHKLGITAHTKKKAPHYVKDQESRAKTGLRKIYNKMKKKILVLDDETYVTDDPSQLPGRKFSHAMDHSQLEYNEKFKGVTKFPKKYLIWHAMDQLGNISEPYISEGTMTSTVYLEECVKKRLIPFTLKHHEIEKIFFWPDLATPHYAKIVTDHLTDENIDFVQKKENPPNVPQARGIEEFWSLCKQRYSN